MIDSLRLKLWSINHKYYHQKESTKIPLYAFNHQELNLNEIEDLLSNVKISYSTDNSAKYMSGKLNNLSVRITPSGLTIEGSLCKYFHNNNLQVLTPHDIALAINKLSNLFQLPLHLAYVYRLDFAYNFIMQRPNQEYLHQFNEARYFKRISIDNKNSLIYSTNLEAMAFYDKYEELQIKNVQIPDKYKDKYILRYEYRILKNLKQKLNRSTPLQLGDIIQPEVYKLLVDKWASSYFKIEKHMNMRFSDSIIDKSIKNLKNAHLLKGLGVDGGLEQYLSMLKVAYDDGSISRSKYYRERQRIKQLSNDEKLTEESDAIAELDKKIHLISVFQKSYFHAYEVNNIIIPPFKQVA
jgi:replication protein CRI